MIISQLFLRFPFGGDKRDRTADLLNAIQALSQLSYTPTSGLVRHGVQPHLPKRSITDLRADVKHYFNFFIFRWRGAEGVSLSSRCEELRQAGQNEEAAEQLPEQLHIQSGRGPGGEGGAGQAGGDGGQEGRLFKIPVFDMGGQSQQPGGEEIEQIDPLGQVLVQAGEGGHIDEQQRAAAHAEAGQDAGCPAHRQRKQPMIHSRFFTPP